MKHLKQFLAVALGLVLLNACKKDDNNGIPTEPLSVTFHLQAPDKVAITQYATLTLTLTELNKNEKVEKVYHNVSSSDFKLELSAGSYEVRAAGSVNYTQSGTTATGEVAGFVSKIDILTATTYTVPLSLKITSSGEGDFIIEEIFFAGTATPEGKQYFGDQYIKLYNPTNKVLYADGLVLADSEFLTVTKRDYTPDVMAEAFTAGSMVQIPGTGTQYPVQPGKSIVIAEQGINHRENNPNSIDLSKADFENFYPPKVKDVDGVGVTNNINLYGIFIFNNRGNRSYVIARFPEGTATATLQYNYEYKVGTKLMKRQALKIPNNWIVDAVNLSTKTGFEWIVTSSSLDSGWAYVANDEKDTSRYGKSVRRKVLSEKNGKPIFKDTNDSTEDFEILTTPTLKK
ncbi:DUF4876 domain-containing protein [uncultured Capnocytophaga sp.]|uniref:DUF4876 domain-containing protein n=1 Tax=uncultured Capnocytophaga sp. TaxID=159273 RepID=UPI002619A9D4|nr:DUF4876 domain-containing protein [uncultured Capnocytophaga sp.]